MVKKLYLILTPTIAKIGGGQIYSLNKLHYYGKLGWSTQLIHCNIGDNIIIEELIKYKEDYFDELKFSTFLYGAKKVKKTIDRIIDRYFLKQYDEIIIESHTNTMATWGEEIATVINAKNFIYLITEFPEIRPCGLYPFFKFKRERGELAGILNTSVQRLFGNFEEIINSDEYQLEAVCSNVIGKENPSKIPSISDYDYLIATIGRIEKPFVQSALQELVLFANCHKDKRIVILFIGDGSENSRNNVDRILKCCDNVKYFITGPLYPIPVDLIRLPNVFFSVAGACNVSRKVGKLTVSFDVNDGSAIGLFGITTGSSAYRRKDEPPTKFSNLLEDILIKKIYKESLIEVDVDAMNRISFDSHHEFIEKGSRTKIYMSASKIRLDNNEYIKKFLISILGVNTFFNLKTKYL